MDFRKWFRTLQFLWYFLFLPRKSDDPVVKAMRQAMIDKALARLAYRFLSADQRQRKYQKKYGVNGYQHRGGLPINPDWDLFDYKNAGLSIWWNKRNFWRAHRLAKWAGFKVRQKVRDYLDRTLLLDIEIREAEGC